MSSIHRRDLLRQAGGALGALGVSRAASAQAAGGQPHTFTPSKRPNLVYVFADQLRYFSCGYAGDEYARTPNIDRLAAKAATSTRPSRRPRSALRTGRL